MYSFYWPRLNAQMRLFSFYNLLVYGFGYKRPIVSVAWLQQLEMWKLGNGKKIGEHDTKHQTIYSYLYLNILDAFLARLQSNSGLWIDDVRLSVPLSVCPSVNILVNLCV